MEKLIGGRYQIVTSLDSGGFGQTYLAEDLHQFNLRCVVKKLHPLSTSPETWSLASQLFQREAQTQYRLGHHPQIPKLLAYFQEQQEFYLVQELIEGHNLSEELTPGQQLSEVEVIALLQDILKPLTFVHGQQVIHRDLKPSNLIRRHRDRQMILIDFGSVKELAATEVLNPQGETTIVTTIGTPGYMPSEQSRGQARLSSDVYAVGMIGLQALTGKRPQDLPEDPETAEIIWREQITVSSRLAEVLDKMVRYDFRDRYRSAVEALEALQQLKPQTSPLLNLTSREKVSLASLQVVKLEDSTAKKTKELEKPQRGKMPIYRENRLLLTQDQALIKSLNLEAKSADPYSLLKEVFDWTGRHPLLTGQLCQAIAKANYFIPSGREALWVEKLVQEQMLHSERIQVIEAYLNQIQEQLLQNKVCLPRMLLQLYLQIVQQGEIITNQSREKQELIKLGLIIEQENKLKVANRIYQAIFNPDWVQQQLWTLEKKSPTTSNREEKVSSPQQPTTTATPTQNEPLTHIAAMLGVLGLLIISPLVIFSNNSSKLTSETKTINLQSLSNSTWCVEAIPSEKAIQEDWRIHLEQERQKLPEQFPANCQNNLDQLIVLNALQLGKENRVLDGIHALCQISPFSESFNQAKFWLGRWYNSTDWGEQSQFYLGSLRDCPAAEKLSAQ